MYWWVPIVVAFVGGPMMWGLSRFDRRNTEQHQQNQEVLLRIEKKIDHIDERVDNHIDYHLEEGL